MASGAHGLLGAGRGKGLRFDLFGFPVTIAPSFVLVALLLGIQPGATFALVASWVAIVVVSVLVHELGHATVAHRLGSKPRIELYGLGGLTTSGFDRELSRREGILLSMAGPSFGFVLGGLLGLVYLLAGDIESRTGRFALEAGLWVNLGWGLVNLLPVLPLDGGHVLVQLLPGDVNKRTQLGRWISAVAGGLATLALIWLELYFGAILFATLVASNVAAAQSAREHDIHRGEIGLARERLTRLRRGDQAAAAELLDQARSSPDRELSRSILAALIEQQALRGRAAEARLLLADPLTPGDPSLHALVAIGESGGLHGLTELAEIARREARPDVVHRLVLACVAANRSDLLLATLAGSPDLRSPELLEVARQAALSVGAGPVAASIAQLAG